MATSISRAASILAALTVVGLAQQQPQTPDTGGGLAAAVAELRHMRPDMTREEQKAKSERIDAAWEQLTAAKDAGAKALLDEAAKLDAAKEKDDFFKLGAAVVLWQIGRFDRVQDIVGLWAGTDLTTNYNYVFYSTFEAVRDGDERALPLLRAVLRDQQGQIYLAMHVMNVNWPGTHFCLWGPMGRKAVPALEQVLDTEKDPIALRSAVVLLGAYMDVGALDRLRRIARDPKHPARLEAIVDLGHLGHPQDFDLLCSGLADKDPKVAEAFVRALGQYGDLRAAAKLAPLTTAADKDLRLSALAGLGLLPTVDGLEALAKCLPNEEKKVQYGLTAYPPILRALDGGWDAFVKADRAERTRLLAQAIAKQDEEFTLRADDRKMSREQLVEACKGWIANSRISGGEYEWAESRHVLAAATAADVPLLLDVRGALFHRLSDECFSEVEIVDAVLRRLVRAQYRLEPGLCDRARPPTKQQKGGKAK